MERQLCEIFLYPFIQPLTLPLGGTQTSNSVGFTRDKRCQAMGLQSLRLVSQLLETLHRVDKTIDVLLGNLIFF